MHYDLSKLVADATGETAASTQASSHAEDGGLKIVPTVIGIQILNIVVLLIVLNFILYKPLLKVLKDRQKKIEDGVENAEKAEVMVKEANQVRADILKNTKVESQALLESARKTGEAVKTTMVKEAEAEAQKILAAGHTQIERETAEAMDQVKAKAVDLIIMAAEKVLTQEIDSKKDHKLIKDIVTSYAS